MRSNLVSAEGKDFWPQHYDMTPAYDIKEIAAMSKYSDKAIALRNDPNTHYNCAQSVIMAFAEPAGISDETAFNVSSNFGSGMKMASVCGAITGGLMTLGLFGLNSQEIVNNFYSIFRKNHDNMLMCADLLRVNAATDKPKKQHCDEMVYEAVAAVEEILRNNMILTD